MDIPSIIHSIEASAPGEWLRTSVKALPIVESIHVLAAATVFGSVFIVDLRLLGLPDTRRPVTLVSREVLRLTWAAFCVAVLAGMLMFTANAHTYYGNTAFRLKMLALIGAGLNMAIFHGIGAKDLPRWESDATPPLPARLAGGLSILLWIAVVACGRWIGFTMRPL